MRDDFVSFKFGWLENIAGDLELPASASRLAIVLGKYLNKTTRDAFPSVRTLSRATGMSERGLQGVFQMLIARGHLRIERGGGRKATNRYLPIMKSEGPEAASSTTARPDAGNPAAGCGVSGEETPQFSAPKPRSRLHPNSFNEQITRAPARDSAAEASKGCRWTWGEFERAWLLPIEGEREAAERAFEGLAPAERVLAIGYVCADRESAEAKGREPRSALAYLFERGWRALVPKIRNGGNIRVSQGGVLFEVWDSAWRVVKGKGIPTDNRGGWLVESELPRGFALPPLATADRATAPVSERAAP